MASAVFDFDLQKTYTQSIKVDDLGNCALRCVNPSYDEYYVVTQTVMGKTYILKFGPLVADMGVPLDEFTLLYKKIDYKELLIEKDINTFINDGRKKINQIETITIPEALAAIPTADVFIPE